MNYTLHLDGEALEQLRTDVAAAVERAGITCDALQLSAGLDECVEIRMTLPADPMLPAVPGRTCDRRRNLLVRAVVESEDSGRPVVWCEVEYSVGRGSSFFSPVPAEYGDRVSIRFGWEFDLPSLTPGYADVRDRQSVHYVSVLPSEDVRLVVQTVWGVLGGRVVLDESA